MLYEPNLPQPKDILDVVSIPPYTPYTKIQKGRYNYLTDLLFHEAAHIEHRRLRNWQHGEGIVDVFPSDEQKEKFLSLIRDTKIFPEWLVNMIVSNINERAISEMYAILIDREAARRYDVQRFDRENKEFQENLKELQNKPRKKKLDRIKKRLKSPHTLGRLLVLIL